jgi:hypothetical protein
MFKIMFALHLLFAIFAIGPLVHAATTASRGVRKGDAVAAAASSRMIRIYAYASVLVIIFGFGLMSSKAPGHPKQNVAEFGDTWIWLSTLLWLVAVALALAVVVPALNKVTASVGTQESVASPPLPSGDEGHETARLRDAALTGRVAAAGGVIGLIFAAVVFLMVYQPGS